MAPACRMRGASLAAVAVLLFAAQVAHATVTKNTNAAGAPCKNKSACVDYCCCSGAPAGSICIWPAPRADGC